VLRLLGAIVHSSPAKGPDKATTAQNRLDLECVIYCEAELSEVAWGRR
jgi:hypothetical protein